MFYIAEIGRVPPPPHPLARAEEITFPSIRFIWFIDRKGTPHGPGQGEYPSYLHGVSARIDRKGQGEYLAFPPWSLSSPGPS